MESGVPARFVVAVNDSISSKRCLDAVVSLAKPCDIISLFHVIDYHRNLTPEEESQYNALTEDEAAEESEKAIPVVKSGSVSYTTQAINRKSGVELLAFKKLAAIRRANNVMLKFKRLGYNVMIVDMDYDVDIRTGHPVVELGSKIAKCADEFDPTYLVVGIGNYNEGCLRKYYAISNQTKLDLSAVGSQNNSHVLLTVAEIVTDSVNVNCSIIAVS